MNTKVTLRKKKITGERYSLYLDFYPAIRIPDTNKSTRRYFLNIYIYAKPKNFIERQHNKEILYKAEGIRCKVTEQLINEKYTFYDKQIEKADFLKYFREESNKHNQKWYYVYQHFAAFMNNKCTFADVNVTTCENFRVYLLKAKNLNDPTKPLSKNSAAGYYSTFRGILKIAYKKRLLKENINDFLEKIDDEETDIVYLTDSELKLLANSKCDFPVLKKAALCSCMTGLRISDILDLQWKHVVKLPDEGYCICKTLIKTKANSVIPISEETYELLGPRKTGFVFKGLTRSMTNRPLKDWINSVGIKKNIHFHVARHTFATLSLAHGTDIYTVSKMLGHKNVSTTQRYAKVVNALKREAAYKISLKEK